MTVALCRVSARQKGGLSRTKHPFVSVHRASGASVSGKPWYGIVERRQPRSMSIAKSMRCVRRCRRASHLQLGGMASSRISAVETSLSGAGTRFLAVKRCSDRSESHRSTGGPNTIKPIRPQPNLRPGLPSRHLGLDSRLRIVTVCSQLQFVRYFGAFSASEA